ncbi:hypothetical protein B7494_g1455 [Chlorociboria aeruginascens]|nr:hypothetical protein B7494_g1455 [Chlorociboria aeruginascens]
MQTPRRYYKSDTIYRLGAAASDAAWKNWKEETLKSDAEIERTYFNDIGADPALRSINNLIQHPDEHIFQNGVLLLKSYVVNGRKAAERLADPENEIDEEGRKILGEEARWNIPFLGNILSDLQRVSGRECGKNKLAQSSRPSREHAFVPRSPQAPRSSSRTEEGKQKSSDVIDASMSNEPQTYMFQQMRDALSITKPVDILEHIYSLPLSEQDAAMEKIRAIERVAMASQIPQPGLMPLMSYLESHPHLKKGICTRNFDTPVNHLLTKFLKGKKFSPIVTRDFRPPKPDPAGILFIARSWGLLGEDGETDASGLIMVGDSIDDMTAGYRAGAATVLLVNQVNAHLATHEHTDLCISRLDELIGVLEDGFVGRTGRGEEDSDTKGRAEEVLREGKGEITETA